MSPTQQRNKTQQAKADKRIRGQRKRLMPCHGIDETEQWSSEGLKRGGEGINRQPGEELSCHRTAVSTSHTVRGDGEPGVQSGTDGGWTAGAVPL